MKKQIIKVNGDKKQIINIRLDDDCKNGHDDFAMTADIYNKARNGRWVWVSGGCCHDEIIKDNPELKIFEILHLRNNIGQPMYVVENGLYHIKENNKEAIKNMFLLNEDETNEIMFYDDKISLLYFIKKHNLEKRWKDYANEGIEKLEELCGQKYTSSKSKYQDLNLTDEEFEKCEKLEKQGYYTLEEYNKRIEKQNIQKIEDKIKEEEFFIKDKISKMEKEFDVISKFLNWVKQQKDLLQYSENILKNYIYYSYNNTISLNWSKSTYNEIPQNVCEEIIKRLDVEMIGIKEIVIKK